MWQKLIYILPFLIVFFVSLYFPSDADLGWHLKYGEYFFTHHQILRDNIFSSEMSGFHWANTSWLTDVTTYAIYHNFGFLGLAIGSAIVVCLTFFFFSKAADLDFFEQSLVFPIILCFIAPVTLVSFRGQLISILFTGVMFYILRIYEETKSRKIYLLIPLFILWINTHGQFLVGLALLYMWILFYIFQVALTDRKQVLRVVKTLLAVVLMSTAGTLMNPFGIEIYKESLMHFNSPDLKFIVEYLPFDELTNFWWNQVILGFLLFFGVLFLVFSNDFKKNISRIGPAFVLYTLAFWVRRYSWTMYYLSMLVLKPVANFFKPETQKSRVISGTVILLLYVLFVLWLDNPLKRLNNMSWQRLCKTLNCSEEAIQYLVKEKPAGELMTMYNWGGFMIWNYPEIKPAVDGRMHLWRDNQGYSAFSYYYPIEQNLRDIENSKYDVVLMSSTKPVYNRLMELVQLGRWKIIYKDADAGVFVRIKQG